MAYLSELVTKKKIIDKKIKELETTLQSIQTEALAEKLYALLEIRQSYLIQIRTANAVSKINIGGKEITIDTAIIIKNTIKQKIDTLTSLINNKDCTLDVIELQKQRDQYYEDYILLSMGITRNDLQVKI